MKQCDWLNIVAQTTTQHAQSALTGRIQIRLLSDFLPHLEIVRGAMLELLIFCGAVFPQMFFFCFLQENVWQTSNHFEISRKMPCMLFGFKWWALLNFDVHRRKMGFRAGKESNLLRFMKLSVIASASSFST